MSIVFVVALHGFGPSPPPCTALAAFGSREMEGRCAVEGDLRIEGHRRDGPSYELSRLPERLTVNGDLHVTLPVTALPRGLVVHGNVMLFKTGIQELPADLEVDGEVDAQLSFGESLIDCDDVPKTARIGRGVRCEE